jgi:hypothetical protein
MDHSSDKHYFHRFTDFYERCFNHLGQVTDVLELGVLKGASVRWLAERFPDARIVGADILPEQPEWPRAERISYKRVDQAHRTSIKRMFDELERDFDLIIEDGSHIPEHQASCLVLGFQHLKPGGMYVLEDIHTSMPHHPYSAKHPRGTPNSLAVLLALQHLADTGRKLTPEIARSLAHGKFFSAGEVTALAREIAGFELFQRTALPLKCYACGSSSFRYAEYRCKCGTPIYFGAESMSFVLTRVGSR